MANPVTKRIGENLKTARGPMGQRELAERVTALGVPMRFNTVSRIEQGHRVADTLELLALCTTLDVTPNRLLLTADADEQPVPLTETTAVASRQAWRWARGHRPLGVEGSTDTVEFQATNRPDEPPDQTPAAEIEEYEDQLTALAREVERSAEELGVPLRVFGAWMRQGEMYARQHDGEPAYRRLVEYYRRQDDQ